MNKIFAGLVLLSAFWHGAQAQVTIVPGLDVAPGITQAAGDLRSAAQFQLDCAAGVQADSCGGKPTPRGCPAGTVWSIEKTGVAHCVVPVVVPPVVPVVPTPLPLQQETTTRACAAGYIGSQTISRTYDPNTQQYSDWSVIADNCTIVSASPVPTCISSDTVTSTGACPAGLVGALLNHTVNSCPGDVVSTYTSGCNPPTFAPEDVNKDGVVDCTDLAIINALLGKKTGQPGFNPNADVLKDGVINVLDKAKVTRAFPGGSTCTPCPNGAVNYPACSTLVDGSPVVRACIAPSYWCVSTLSESGQARDNWYEFGWTKWEGPTCLATSGSEGQRSGLEGGCPAGYSDGVPVWGPPSGYADGKP